jgi:hypothetical protein
MSLRSPPNNVHDRSAVSVGGVAEADGFSCWQYAYNLIRGPSGPRAMAGRRPALVVLSSI